MKLLERTACVISGLSDLEPLETFPRFPVLMGATDTSPESDQFADLEWAISRGTGMIQLRRLVPPEILYAESHNESVGEVWDRHHRAFAAFVAEAEPRSVLEIGSAHGALARRYAELRPTVAWTSLEPTAAPSLPGLVRGFLDSAFRPTRSFDAIVHSHVLEHAHDPRGFISHIAALLPEAGLQVFSVPDLAGQLRRGQTNVLNFEHTCLLADPYIDALLSRAGFQILEKRRFEEHSFFYLCRKSGAAQTTTAWPNLYAENRRDFIHAFSDIRSATKIFSQAIADRPAQRVHLFGAHVFSQTLLNCGLPESAITSVLDNGPAKIGKRLYGTGLKIESPNALASGPRPLVVVRTGSYDPEIRAQLRAIRPDAEILP